MDSNPFDRVTHVTSLDEQVANLKSLSKEELEKIAADLDKAQAQDLGVATKNLLAGLANTIKAIAQAVR